MSSTGTIETIGWIDYVVIGVMLLISTIIGIFFRFTGGRQRTMEEYFKADRSMGAVPIALGLTVSFMSAINLLGVSADNYVNGTQFMALYLGSLLATPVSLYLYNPVFLKLQTTSTFEYLNRRFGVTARLVASIASFLHLQLYTGIVLYAPALALEATTGLSVNLSIILIGTICTFYSVVGGIKAVLVTDMFQGVLMYLAVFMIIALAAINVDGGIIGIWQEAVRGGRVELDNFSPDPTMRHTWWSVTIGGFVLYVTMNGINQVQIQRLLTLKSAKSVQLAMWASWPLGTIMGLATCFSGIAMFAYFKDCDPVAAGKISSTDMLMPYFAMLTMSQIPGLAGLFIAGVFSASLSTVSAILNSLSAVALEDYVKAVYKRIGSEFPKKRATLISKILAVFIGLLSMVVAFLAQHCGSLIQTSLSISGLIGGPLLGIFPLGMFFQTAEERGTVTGALASVALLSWMAFGQPKPSSIPLLVSTKGCNVTTLTNATLSIPRQVVLGDSSDFYLYRISYMWYAPIGIAVCIVVGLAMSNSLRLVSKRTHSELEPDLFTPFVASRIRRRQLEAQRVKSTLCKRSNSTCSFT